MTVGCADIPLCRAIGAQQADLVNHARQRPHRESTARIAHQENPVAGPVAAGQPTIGTPDLPVDAAPQRHIGRTTPVGPLDASLVIKRYITQARQQLVGQACICLVSGREG